MFENVTSCLHSGWNCLSTATSKVLSTTEQLTHSVATNALKAYSTFKKQVSPHNRNMIYLSCLSYYGWRHHIPAVFAPAVILFAAAELYKSHRTSRVHNDPMLQKIFQAEDAIKTRRDTAFVLQIKGDLIRYFNEHPTERLSETQERDQEIKKRISEVNNFQELEIALLLAHAAVTQKKGGLLDTLEESDLLGPALFVTATALGYLQGAGYFEF